jgi:hypothetical protein
MDIIEVRNQKEVKEFLQVAPQINRAFPHYVQPLDSDIEDIFNPEKNKNFQHGKAVRWILKNGDVVIGRIAAFVNEDYKNDGTDFPTGCVGFFECSDNQAAANLLFDEAKKWLQQQGVAAMDGPVNFGDRDKFWGLLVNGFHEEPPFGMNFNPPYYQKLFEGYGFRAFYNQYYYAMNIDDELPEKYKERYEKLKSKGNYSAAHIEKNNLEKYATDFATIYNAAWAQHNEAKTITKEAVMKLFQKMKPIIDERIIWFAYYKNEPIAMWINIPDLNQFYKYFGGKFRWTQKLRLLYMKKTNRCKRFIGIVFGIIPKFQSLGIDAFIICEGAKFIQHKKLYERYEMGWTGDWNPRMMNIYRSLGGKCNRHLITYRYIFDNKYPFQPHPIMDYATK